MVKRNVLNTDEDLKDLVMYIAQFRVVLRKTTVINLRAHVNRPPIEITSLNIVGQQCSTYVWLLLLKLIVEMCWIWW